MNHWRWFYRLASPSGFYHFANRILPWCTWFWGVSFATGLLWALVIAPQDYLQGQGYRIIFIHVPAAWMSLFIYTLMTIAAVIFLVWRLKLAIILIVCAAPLGAIFTFLTLLTGSIWGKPMWGTWWAWDARLTSELILLFLYLGIIALHHAEGNKRSLEVVGAIFVIIGFVNIPVIHFSVEWWSTLHQPASILKLGAPSIHSSMLWPLLWMALSFKLSFIVSVLLAMQIRLLSQGRQWVQSMKISISKIDGKKEC